tara:strand:+ start:788 stop:1516 length:729 start_codon:yes stop_codon:yes gene_type:complete
MKETMYNFGFGTAKLHHIKQKSKRFKVLDAAYEGGFKHFDTSPYYGNGIGQNTLYEWIQMNNLTKDITIASKFGLYPLFYTITNSYAKAMFIKILEKLIKKNNEINFSFEACDKFISHYYEKWGLQPNILFLHEPILFFSEEMDFKDSIFNLINLKYPEMKLGIAGDNLSQILKKNYEKNEFLIQTKFKSFKNADYYYNCLDENVPLKNFIYHNNDNIDKYCMLYSSTDVKRIKDFSNKLLL